VHVRTRTLGESFEEILKQFGLKVTDQSKAELEVHHRMRPSTQVDCCYPEGFIHRHHKVARTIDPATGADRLRHRLAECDSHVLYRVVLVDVEITHRINLQIKSTMPGRQLKHVVKESDTRANGVPTLSFEAEANSYLRFRGLSVD
jgi:hypothetical protein|tara:strand:- start:71 stop:508 length:438 start_codon:yes stop_codon:yes gene_type:complete